MITPEEAELTTTICHIERFSKSDIPIYSPAHGWQNAEKNKEKTKNARICKALYVSGSHKMQHIFL